jgi:hypothetical protein
MTPPVYLLMLLLTIVHLLAFTTHQLSRLITKRTVFDCISHPKSNSKIVISLTVISLKILTIDMSVLLIGADSDTHTFNFRIRGRRRSQKEVEKQEVYRKVLEMQIQDKIMREAKEKED